MSENTEFEIIKNKQEILAANQKYVKEFEFVLNLIEQAIIFSNPRVFIKENVMIVDDRLSIFKSAFELNNYKNIYLIGFGKASGVAVEELTKILKKKITKGLVVVPYGGTYSLPKNVEVVFAGHPHPDKNSIYAAQKIFDLLEGVTEDDLVIFFISGGGSALVEMPIPPITLEDLVTLTEMLLKSGADIHEINTIRKHISMVKGGWLAKKAYPATVVALIISDVVGDDLSVIASGPTVPDPTTFSDAEAILKKYNLWEQVPGSIKQVITRGVKKEIEDTPKKQDKYFYRLYNFLIGSNKFVLEKIDNKAVSRNINSLILTTLMRGESREVAKFVASIAKEITAKGHPVPKPALLIIGGETTVTVKGTGRGGRNQEFALSAAIEIAGVPNIIIASFDTDGIDGTSPAAGAIVSGDTVLVARKKGLIPGIYLENNDSFTFFNSISGHLIFTGPTGTNINDIVLVYVF